ncbi:12260_t:CDS:2 [Acaulospora morrowiae]|uniref:12260_t:CDS:1 n=1 Tax=Acaulospora morrowiae TaxID=94023 RepID=A0A9N9CXD5_9GLOM|nr:12260_t:CDS:2 [Acaulospora morrowiae]
MLKRTRSASTNLVDDDMLLDSTNDHVTGDRSKKQKNKDAITPSTSKVIPYLSVTRSTKPLPELKLSSLEDDGKEIKVRNCLMWFRTDLRIKDNIALYQASSFLNTSTDNYLFALYVISPEEWKSHDVAPARVDFWFRNLKELKKRLSELNIPLIIQTVDLARNVPASVIELCEKLNVSHVFANIEYEVDEMRRDNRLLNMARKNSISVQFLHSQCIVEPGMILTKEGKTYTIYTPFKNSWIKFVESNISLLDLVSDPVGNSDKILELYPETFEFNIPDSIPGFDLDVSSTCIQTNFPAGEPEAHRRLGQFVANKIGRYNEARDVLSRNGSSSLSPYIASGIISARQCVLKAYLANRKKLSRGNIGIAKWIEEIVWREFYRHILVGFPHVCKNQPFKLHMSNIRWNENEEYFRRWCQGKTGYPIVDAGMRQLNGSGWMHNRARMIVAMFLVKDLLIDWRKGEKYFMNHLIDGDFANNNGGWQWCASTGSDAQPYFRIFNPTSQSQKCDPNGDYIRKWVPELKNLSSLDIHDPFKSLPRSEFKKLGYPEPIVDHAVMRVETLNRFRHVKR